MEININNHDMLDITDSILICDVDGTVMYYKDFNDEINMLRSEDALGKSIFDLYPFLERHEFTVFKAIDQKRPILNELQYFEVNGITKKSINSAYPLINKGGVVGGIIMAFELASMPGKKKRSKIAAKYNFSDILTDDESFKMQLKILEQLAAHESTILILGETGSGKELIAHTIHANSGRQSKPFVIQNCAAIPSTLMESLLFGTSKGSYTDAVDNIGIFESAKGGTLFLDEINSMSLDLQAKILRAIENQTIRRIGESHEREIDVRIIASTNQDLKELVKKGAFRADLYYRLSVVTFEIPPLRKRPKDIELISNHYIDYYNRQFGHNVEGIEHTTMQHLLNYDWGGNIRELRNVIEHILNIKKYGTINLNDLPLYLIQDIKNNDTKELIDVTKKQISGTLSEQLSVYERDIIEEVYNDNRYNISKTATVLDISRQTLYNKLKKYSLI